MKSYFFKVEQRSILVDNNFQYRFVLYYPYGDTGQLTLRGYGEWTTSYNKARSEGIEKVEKCNEQIERQIKIAREYHEEWKRLYANPKD